MRTQRNWKRPSLSERMMATRSLGPVPALLLMTRDMPAARITHPATMLTHRTGKGEAAEIHRPSSQVKRSIMGPPRKAHTTVPGFT